MSQELVRECLYKGRFIHFHTNNEVHFAGINPDDKLSCTARSRWRGSVPFHLTALASGFQGPVLGHSTELRT